MPEIETGSIVYAYPFWGDLTKGEPDYSMDVVATRLAVSVGRAGYKPIVVLRREAEGPARVDIDAVEYRIVPWRFRGRTVKSRALKRLFSAMSMLAYGVSVGWQVRRVRASIVHIYIFDELIPIIRALTPPSTRLVLHMHDHRQTLGNSSQRRRRLSKADLLVGCSEFITKSVRSAFPDLDTEFETVLNAVDPDLFSPPEERKDAVEPRSETRLLFVGRLSPEKGVHTLLEAFTRIREAHPEVSLGVIGPPNLASFKTVATPSSRTRLDAIRHLWVGDAYQQRIKSLIDSAAPDSIDLYGPIPNDQLPAVLRSVDVFVFPSVWDEPFGLPVLEAMASGIPVVAGDVGGIKESMKHEETGYLFSPGDVDELALWLDRLIESRALRLQMGKAARERVLDRFSWSCDCDDWISLYRRML